MQGESKLVTTINKLGVFITIRYLIIVFTLPVMFLSCVAAGSMPALRGDNEASDKGGKEFIELKDGTIIEGDITKVSLATLLAIKKIGNVTLEGKKYGYKEINAFQKDNKYYRKDAYGYFDERITKGRINGYLSFHTGESIDSKGNSRSFSYYLYYLQKGDRGPVVAYEIKVLKKMIADYQPAVDEYNKYDALSKKEKKFKRDNCLDHVVYTYNHQ